VRDPLTDTLRAVRARVKLSRTVEMAVRWTLYASILACVCLTAAKFLPVAPHLAALAVIVPLAAAAAAAARPLPLRECAALVDGAFRLDERVATAAELAGGSPMADAQREDARRALAAVDARSVGRVRWPRETALLAVTAGLIAALSLAPSAGARPSALPAELEAVSAREAAKLAEAARDPRVAAHARELARISELLRSDDPAKLREAVLALQALEDAIGRELASGRPSSDMAKALRELADRAAGAGAGIGRELAAAGVDVEPQGPASANARLELSARAAAAARSQGPESWDVGKIAAGAAASLNVRASAEESIRRRRWDAKYDPVVKRYYEERP